MSRGQQRGRRERRLIGLLTLLAWALSGSAAHLPELHANWHADACDPGHTCLLKVLGHGAVAAASVEVVPVRAEARPIAAARSAVPSARAALWFEPPGRGPPSNPLLPG